MKLIDKPLVLDWMNFSEKEFRSNIKNSFLKAGNYFEILNSNTCEFEGFFDNGIQSVVGKVTDKYGSYVLKTRSDKFLLLKEFYTYVSWRSKDSNVIEYIGRPKIVDGNTFLLMEYFPLDKASILINNTAAKQNQKFFYDIGENLFKMHSVKNNKWGNITDTDSLLAEKDSFKNHINEEFDIDFTMLSKELIDLSLQNKFEVKVSEINKYIINNKLQASLCHFDLGLHNILGIEDFRIIDGNPIFSFGLIDLAISFIWLNYLGLDATDNLLDGYLQEKQIDKTLWDDCMYVALIIKLNKWIPRSSSEDKVKVWVSQAKKMLENLT